MNTLVDSSVWIAYFRDGGEEGLEFLLDEDLAVVNDLILAELVPFLEHQRQQKLIGLLRLVRRVPLAIDWEDVIRMQVLCLRHGINGVGLADLIIAQNAITQRLALYTRDRHFQMMSRHVHLVLHP